MGDTTGIADVNDPNTSITTPASDATITATYSQIYTLTVISGSGSGSYTSGKVVAILADESPEGQGFITWIGDTTGIADVNSSYTTITTQASDATITATYTTLPTYTLDVVSGTGDGNYVEGKVVTISADPPPSSKAFFVWVGDTGGIDNINREVTTLTMPASAATITATYQDAIEITGPTTITLDNRYYRLTQDISAPGTAIVINAEDITLDLGGYTITYNTSTGTGPFYGVYSPLGTGEAEVRDIRSRTVK